MRNVKRFLLVLLIAGAVFFFRNEIGDFWNRYRFFDRPDTYAGLLLPARDARQTGDYTLALHLLEKVEGELARRQEPLDEEQQRKRRRLRKQLQCELAAVQKELAMDYLRKGDVVLYQQHIQLSQKKFQVCAAEQLGE